MAEYLTVALLSIMIFYSFGIAFNVHKTLDKENAGKLLRKLSVNGKKSINKLFSIKKTVTSYEDLYLSMLKK